MDDEELRKSVRYNKQTGEFSCPQHKHTGGYLQIGVGGRKFYAHRLAWFLVYGFWPSQIDHINRDKTDNRIANLRIANSSQNGANRGPSKASTSGIKGVTWQSDRKKWYAHIRVNYRKINLGRYTNIEDAKKAYVKAALKYFGKHYA